MKTLTLDDANIHHHKAQSTRLEIEATKKAITRAEIMATPNKAMKALQADRIREFKLKIKQLRQVIKLNYSLALKMKEKK